MRPALHSCRVFIVLGLLAAVLSPVHGAIEKTIRFESDPPGAEVYRLRGNRKMHLGATPLRHKLRFHSDISVIRIAFEKEGMTPKTVKVNASSDTVTVNLHKSAATKIVADYSEPYLRDLQKKLGPSINAVMDETEAAGMDRKVMRDGLITWSGSKGNVTLIVPLAVADSSPGIEDNDENTREDRLFGLWQQIETSHGAPLVNTVLPSAVVDNIMFRVRLVSGNFNFRVKPAMRAETTMQCAPGYRTQTVTRYRQVPQYESYSDKYGYHTRMTGYKSESYTDTEQIYDACHHKVPVTRMVPTATPALQHGAEPVVTFVLDLDGYSQKQSARVRYGKLDVRLVDSKGATLVQRAAGSTSP